MHDLDDMAEHEHGDGPEQPQAARKTSVDELARWLLGF